MVVAILASTKTISNQTGVLDDFSSGTQAGVFSESINWTDLAPISLLAFQSAGQVVASRVLKFNEIPTVVLTSLIADMMSDAHLVTAGLFHDSKRNRRVAAIFMLLGGAICGGVFTKGWIGFAGALWVAASIKGIMVIAWLIWAPKPVEVEEEGEPNGQS